MASYSHEYSNFPEQLYVRRQFLDVKDAPTNVAAIITQIKNLVVNQNYQAAYEQLYENQNILSQYMIDAKYINTIEEELRNLEIYARKKVQGLYYQEREPDGVTGDIWIA